MSVIIVNEKDEVIGYKPRNERLPSEIGRVSRLLIFNSKDEMLIARRVMSKKIDPGKWGPAVAGTVEEGETYISNIIKETQEEIGFTINESDLKILSHMYRDTSHKFFVTTFMVMVDKSIEEFKKQDEEVEEIRWVNINDLKEWCKNSPLDFIPRFGDYINIEE
ncbi:MAG: NUDIX domain-containing protein [Patescibacteria group bacterium]